MIELNTIYNEDCIAGMSRIPDASVDAIICDLPYGTTRNAWDSIIPLDDLWTQYKRVIRGNGAIVLFAQCPFDKVLGASNIGMLKYEWIWQKESGTGFLNAKRAPLKDHENILVFGNCRIKYNPQMRSGFSSYKCKSGKQKNASYDYKHMHDVVTESNGERYPKTVLSFDRERGTFHPTQKPTDLVRYLVRTYTSPGDVVLDNCIGSGTTAIACMLEGRNYIGFELNKEYFQKACERVEKERSQLRLNFNE